MVFENLFSVLFNDLAKDAICYLISLSSHVSLRTLYRLSASESSFCCGIFSIISCLKWCLVSFFDLVNPWICLLQLRIHDTILALILPTLCVFYSVCIFLSLPIYIQHDQTKRFCLYAWCNQILFLTRRKRNHFISHYNN